MYLHQVTTRPCSIFCIVPPHMQEGIIRAAGGNRERLDRALQGLQLDHSIRNGRIGFHEATRPFRAARRRQRLRGLWRSAMPVPNLDRTIYDAGHGSGPGRVVRREGDPPVADDAVNEAYDGLGDTFELYWEIYNRNSIDDEGLPLDGIVHYQRNYDNAFWDGRQMFFGDGDGELFTRFTISVDVIGHELTHGVTQDEAGLIYWAQSGALNESVSDVFGSLVKQYVNNESAEQADWLIGEGLLIPKTGTNRQALRSMKAPGTAYDDPELGGKDPQPASMLDYVHTQTDNGGVHINSGIPNHAFYLVAVKLGGNAWEKAGLIWYETLLSPALRRKAQFQDFASLTVSIAQQLFGTNSAERQAVYESWREVDITV
jgi:Zn-dependent metalloprotease